MYIDEQVLCLSKLEALHVFKNGPSLASFIVYFRSFQANTITIFTTNTCEKISMQYVVPGFKPTAFRTRVSSHYH